MSRSSRSFGRRAFLLGIAIPTLKFTYDRRDWFQSVEYEDSGSINEQEQQLLHPLTFAATSNSSKNNKVTVINTAIAQQIRNDAVSQLADARVDILVIGGGATGLFAALDAASRGLSVALVEQSDFGSGATGSSTTLLHCGFKHLQAAFRQRDHKQVLQVVQDASELRILDKISASKFTREMPTLLAISSFTELSEFLACSAVFFACSLFGGLLQVAYPVLPSTVTNEFSGMNGSETDSLWCGFVVPERQVDGAGLCRALARTASTKHGAKVLNYARVIGLDCAENPRREPSEKFTVAGMGRREMKRRGLTSDGQPYPWFETANETDYFLQEPTSKDRTKDGEDVIHDPRSVELRPLLSEEEVNSKSAAREARAGRDEERPFYSVDAAVVRDELTGKIFRIYPKFVLNCAGAGSDSIRRMFPEAQKTLYERFSAQFYLVARHPITWFTKGNSSSDNNNNNNNKGDTTEQQQQHARYALVSARNHTDAKPLFVFPFWSSSVVDETGGGGGDNYCWSLVGPVDAPMEDAGSEHFTAPEKTIISGDPSTTSPSLFRELKLPRISASDLSFIATAADAFGVHVDSGFAHATPRVLCESWPGAHPPLARALRFGGSVDYRTLHQKIVHSVGTELVWSRKKAEAMVDSYFIEQSRIDSKAGSSSGNQQQQQKVKIPATRTQKLALAVADAEALRERFHNEVLVADKNTNASDEADVRFWARCDGCATVLDALLRRMDPARGFVKCIDKQYRDDLIRRTAQILAEEWGWSKKRLESEITAAKVYFERNCFAE